MMLVHEGLPEGEMLHGNIIYDEGLPERGSRGIARGGNVAR